MDSFWEIAFREKGKMWGEKPTLVAKETALLFYKNNVKNILIPGIGYGRNAMPFIELGMNVSGIEISETAIYNAKEQFGSVVKIYKGSVLNMPFDKVLYGGIFCHALIHLLSNNERSIFLEKCKEQLAENGLMVFTAITKKASTYGVGSMVEKDQYRTKDGLDLFFYDEVSIQKEFESYGLIGFDKIYEPRMEIENSNIEFWKITGQK